MNKWIKKAFHKFIINENGAVSIYAIMITLLLFVFNAVLIDYVRVMAAERKIDQAVKAATRSTMASFDKSMMGSYGLFGFKGDENDIFQKVLKEHLNVGESGYFNFAQANFIDGSVSFDEATMLGAPDTFRYQMLEDMKYKAPLIIGESILEGFLSVSEEMEQASNIIDIAKEFNKKIDEREEKLDEAKEELDKAKAKIEPLENRFTGGAVSGAIRSYPNVGSLTDILENISKFEDDLENEEDSEDTDDASDAAQNIKTFKEETERIIKALNDDLKSLNDHLIKAEEAIEAAQKLNAEAKELLDQAEDTTAYDNANNASSLAENSSVDASDARGGLTDAMNSLEDLLIEDSFFTQVLNPLEDAIYKSSTTRGGNTLYKFLTDKLKEIENGNIENGLLSAANVTAISFAISEFEKAKADIDKVFEEFDKRPDMKDEPGVREKEKEVEENFENASKILEESIGAGADFLGYRELLDKVQKYSDFSEAVPDRPELDDSSRDDMAGSSMNIVDLIFSSIGDVLINSRDAAYVNEYILMRFNHHNFSTRGAGAAGSSDDEVEFILYGLDSPQLNLAAALGEIFAFRFAVNFIEAFTRQEVRAFGKFMVLAAIGYAFLETGRDMIAIQQGKPFRFIEIGPPFMTGYKDYLRLFLFVHPEGKKIERSLARIDQKTNNDLTTVGTYLEGEVEASVDLWFLPGVAEMLGDAGIMNGSVQDGKFHIRKKAVYSY
jgi:tetratricopeptide (TPR) repeat protein